MGIQYICSSHYACLVGVIALPNIRWWVCILLSLSQYLLSLMRTKVSPLTSMSPTTRIHLLEVVVMLKSSLGVCTSPQSTSGSSLLVLHWCLSAIPSVMWCHMQFSQRFLDQHLKWVTPPIAHSYAERHCLPFSNPRTYQQCPGDTFCHHSCYVPQPFQPSLPHYCFHISVHALDRISVLHCFTPLQSKRLWLWCVVLSVGCLWWVGPPFLCNCTSCLLMLHWRLYHL